MTTWIALLRGINVGGRNRLSMQQLKGALETLGCEQVHTYVQSGNAVFAAPDARREGLGAALSRAIGDESGFTPDVTLLRSRELENAVRANPYPEADANPGSVHLYFMNAAPVSDALARLDALKAASESVCLRGRVLYLSAPHGIGRSRLVKNLDRALGAKATGRNWRTVTKLLEMCV